MRHAVVCIALSTAAVVLAIGATAAPAAPKTKPQLAVMESTSSELRRSVFSGNEMQITTFYTLKSDCLSAPLVDVRILKPPAHGEISLQEVRSVIELEKEHFRAHCHGKSIDAVAMFYTSQPDFTGMDKLQVEVDFRNGKIRRYTISVNVR